jgi:hypothetical protein
LTAVVRIISPLALKNPTFYKKEFHADDGVFPHR